MLGGRPASRPGGQRPASSVQGTTVRTRHSSPSPTPPVPLVSVAVAAYVATPAQAALLDETLGTVDARTCRDCEVVVVDDGSPLDVAGVAGRHAATTTLRQADAGPARARNAGIAARR